MRIIGIIVGLYLAALLPGCVAPGGSASFNDQGSDVTGLGANAARFGPNSTDAAFITSEPSILVSEDESGNFFSGLTVGPATGMAALGKLQYQSAVGAYAENFRLDITLPDGTVATASADVFSSDPAALATARVPLVQAHVSYLQTLSADQREAYLAVVEAADRVLAEAIRAALEATASVVNPASGLGNLPPAYTP